MKTIELYNRRMKSEYLKIETQEGVFAAGNQGWWKALSSSGKSGDYAAFRKDSNYRLWQMGCGVIAMTDAELYLASADPDLHRKDPESGPEPVLLSEGLSEQDYRQWVMEKMRQRYVLPGDPAHYLVGVFPQVMVRGLRQYFASLGKPQVRIRWAPFCTRPGQAQRVLTAVEEMLQKDLPVVCSYHSFQKKTSLYLYARPEAVGCGKEQAEASVQSHYMTVIGMLWEEGENGEKNDVIWKVVSWGRIYYISYLQYQKKLSYFTNILFVK